MTRYAELDVTTNFSFLRGGSHPEELVATAKALGLAAIAVTDANTLAGAVRAHLAAKETGIKFIVGARLDLEDAPSLLAYPTDRAAYGRLCRLLTLGQRRAEKGQCTLYLADVAAHAEGLIFLALPPDDYPALCQGIAAIAAISPLPPCGGARSAKGRSEGGESLHPLPHKEGGGTSSSTADNVISLPPHPSRHATCARPSDQVRGSRKIAAGSPLPNGERVTFGSATSRNPSPRGGEGGDLDFPSRAPGEGDRSKNFETELKRIKIAIDGPLYLTARHSYRGGDRARIAALAQLAKRVGIPLVATNGVLYHAPHRRQLQDVLTCIREKCTIHEAGLRLEANQERHVKSPADMARLFKGHEDALERTVEIANACAFSLDELKYEYPDEPVPEGKTPQSHLEDLTWEGAAWRYRDGIPGKVRDTLTHELALIAKLEYARYFLTVHDIVRFARSQGILCQGRGSAANSAVCYCLAITNVDPTEIDLLFERFVSPERKEPPDIDVDFEHERREEVIQYIYARYGRDRAGLAATVICYRGRLAVREVGKALGLSEDTVAALATTIWGLSNAGLPDEYVRQAGLDPSDPLLARVLELTQELIGFPRHLSQHVGGFVLTRGPLSEVVPIGNAAMEDRTYIEWDKDDLDALGLLKVDVLGLGMLTCIRKAFAFLREHYGKDVTLGTVPRDDPAVYDMLCKADSIGVFQVESRAQMNMLPRLKPRTFYDLVIEVAIVRPGPIQGDMVHPYLRRRCGDELPDYPSPHPDHGPADELCQVLGKTMGVPLFQEQAMRLAMEAAKFTSEEANELRRAMATFRRRGTIDKLHAKMVGRMTARGYPQDFAERCFNQIKGFGEYGFPESHAASFAHLVYVSAWLKCHYPAAFAAALLNSQPMGFYAPAQIVGCARAHGVEARAPDVNMSLWDCTLEPLCDESANSVPPLDGEGGAPSRSSSEAVAHLKKGAPGGVSIPVPAFDPPPRRRFAVSDLPTRGRYALRLGLRQIDGLREDDAKRLVAIRDGLPEALDPHLFCPQPIPLSPLPPCGGARAACGAEGGESLAQSLSLTPLPERHAIASAFAPKGAAADKSRWAAPTLPHKGGGGTSGEAQGKGFADMRDLWRRTGLKRACIEKLAAADAFRSLGLDRRQALWGVRGLPTEVPLPLFDRAATAESGAEPEVMLPVMPLSEHVVNDYRTLRLSLKAHPMSFLRARVAKARIAPCADLKNMRDGDWVAVAGVILVRQRPGSAQGVVFMTIEDETGIANAVIWPNVLERERKVVMGARLVVVHGRMQRHEDIIHVVAARLEDRSDWLRLLTDDGEAMSTALANADEVRRPDPGSWRGARDDGQPPLPLAPADHVKHPLPGRAGIHPRWHPRRHPRHERIIPKSRDFH